MDVELTQGLSGCLGKLIVNIPRVSCIQVLLRTCEDGKEDGPEFNDNPVFWLGGRDGGNAVIQGGGRPTKLASVGNTARWALGFRPASMWYDTRYRCHALLGARLRVSGVRRVDNDCMHIVCDGGSWKGESNLKGRTYCNKVSEIVVKKGAYVQEYCPYGKRNGSKSLSSKHKLVKKAQCICLLHTVLALAVHGERYLLGWQKVEAAWTNQTSATITLNFLHRGRMSNLVGNLHQVIHRQLSAALAGQIMSPKVLPESFCPGMHNTTSL
ncbi:hypothetical protein GGX14DRAFT_582576 [Mycena pura]|uniref:Uncharacterized protein n=1 Tax=Mycena pura TaxID=153505 RepID=A0AAD6YVQ1_9AGAR|nr:hypothetical protein GGX14DRAFT_582576 [Mycena pura]